jgi:hypothetical protein
MKNIEITLTPDYCCGGGHCGPMPGYIYKCPYCNEDTNAQTFDYLKVGQGLICAVCKEEMKAVKKISEFVFEFEVIKE